MGGWFGDGAIGGGEEAAAATAAIGHAFGFCIRRTDIMTPGGTGRWRRGGCGRPWQVQQMARRRQRRWRELLGFFGSFGSPTSTADSLTTASSVDGVSSTSDGMRRKALAEFVRLEVLAAALAEENSTKLAGNGPTALACTRAANAGAPGRRFGGRVDGMRRRTYPELRTAPKMSSLLHRLCGGRGSPARSTRACPCRFRTPTRRRCSSKPTPHPWLRPSRSLAA